MFHNFSSDRLPALRDSAILPVSTLNAGSLAEPKPSFWQRHRFGVSVAALFLVLIFGASWYAMNTIRPFSSAIDLNMLNQELMTSVEEDPIATQQKIAQVKPEAEPASETQTTDAEPEPASTVAAAENETETATRVHAHTWLPNSDDLFWDPQDHPPVDPAEATRVLIVTVRAKVTAYTPYDHAQSHPQWADGVVAWHPRNRKRHVNAHPYCLATDWTQFPGGATFIRVPGYMPKSFPSFPENFRVVDDKCGRARRDKRAGRQPVVDVRYLTRHSAISGRDAWGMKELDVEVIFPAGFKVPSSLRPWIISVEWRTYKDGAVLKTETVY